MSTSTDKSRSSCCEEESESGELEEPKSLNMQSHNWMSFPEAITKTGLLLLLLSSLQCTPEARTASTIACSSRIEVPISDDILNICVTIPTLAFPSLSGLYSIPSSFFSDKANVIFPILKESEVSKELQFRFTIMCLLSKCVDKSQPYQKVYQLLPKKGKEDLTMERSWRIVEINEVMAVEKVEKRKKERNERSENTITNDLCGKMPQFAAPKMSPSLRISGVMRNGFEFYFIYRLIFVTFYSSVYNLKLAGKHERIPVSHVILKNKLKFANERAPDFYSRTNVLPNTSNSDQLSSYWKVRTPVIREIAYNAYRTTVRFIVLIVMNSAIIQKQASEVLSDSSVLELKPGKDEALGFILSIASLHGHTTINRIIVGAVLSVVNKQMLNFVLTITLNFWIDDSLQLLE
ncbi:unnamed protein product [Brugia pahangi]|uniref:ABC transmembrane type-1 domain-containing protein n=1 Tax=Brugia pahangi TaxID=6280 RepID=A0A158PQ92_BRUPA|nr:unnamed protein product [Brugia pahangi]